MTASFQSAGVEDAYGTPTYGTAVTLGNIYIRPTRNIYAATLGDDKRYDMVLYFDAQVSTPSGQTFKAKDLVVSGGVTYNVRKAEPLYDPTTGALHHWEVQLAGC
jgi:hypothetical protein